jgi:hypothetical protein
MKKQTLVFIFIIKSVCFFSQSTPQQTIKGDSFPCAFSAAIYSVTALANTNYIWSLPQGWVGSSITNSIVVFPNLNSGTLSLNTTNANEKIKLTLETTVINCNGGLPKYGINGFDGIIDIYKNPNYNNFYIDYNGDLTPLKVFITDILGQEVYKVDLNPNFKTKIKLRIDDGFYFLKIYDCKKFLVLFKKISLN